MDVKLLDTMQFELIIRN